MRQPRGGMKITLLYILFAPAIAGYMLVHLCHYKINLLVAIAICYVAELVLAGVFSIGKKR